MSSRGKKKTTFAKLNREARLRERRHEKAARKEARREAAESPVQAVEDFQWGEIAEEAPPVQEESR